mgnify:CR=1 FL=1|tara:strand:+ start:71 stop:304 length:234 start_codon:yes stop_codon:yes gene_type:complete
MAGLLGAALRGLGRAVKKSPGTSGKLRSKNMQDFLKETKLKARESMKPSETKRKELVKKFVDIRKKTKSIRNKKRFD